MREKSWYSIIIHPTVMSFFVLFFVWWAASLFIPAKYLPGPFSVGKAMVGNILEGDVQYHLYKTFVRVALGFALSMALGTGIGIAMGSSRFFEQFFNIWVTVSLTIPSLCWAILAVMWFGLSDFTAIFAITMICYCFVSVNIWEGVKAINRNQLEMAQVFRADRLLILRKIYIPSLMPYIFAAIRYSFGLSWKIVVIAEMFGLSTGVGYMLVYWYGMFNLKQVLAWTLTFTVVMLVIENFIIKPAHAKVLAWRGTSLQSR